MSMKHIVERPEPSVKNHKQCTNNVQIKDLCNLKQKTIRIVIRYKGLWCLVFLSVPIFLNNIITLTTKVFEINECYDNCKHMTMK